MHSNTIFGFLVLAFVVHITSQGKLPKYLGFFVGPVKTPSAQSAISSAVGTNAAAGGFGPLGAAFGMLQEYMGMLGMGTN